VAGAGVLIRTLRQLEGINPGFRQDHILAVSFDLTAGPFRGPGNQQPHFRDFLARVSALPGVRMAGAISEAPLVRRRAPDQPMTLEGQPLPAAADPPHVILLAVTPAYFSTMGIPLKKGRLFQDTDTGDGKMVAIVNETAARLLWHGEDPIGKRLGTGARGRYGYFRVSPRPGEPEWREVVGVVADVRSSGLDLPPQPEVYHCYLQHPGMNLRW
jgi:putative ABC transport system permease protein